MDLDELNDVAPEDFVAARDALAKALKAEGKVKDAADVKALKKPTVPVWIAEQVRRHHDDVVDALRDAASAVASAQEAAIATGDRDALKAATAAHKDARRDVGKAVEQVLARNGRPATYKDDVLGAIDAAITDEVTGGAFGMRSDVDLPKAKGPTKAELEAARKERERAAAKAKAEIEKAEARVERARAELEDAESDLAAVMERHAGVDADA
jgi:hypothetical protein